MEQYVQGRISDTEQESFEEHLAECDACTEELTRLGALRTELARRRDEIETTATGIGRTTSPSMRWLAVAAALILALLLVFLWRPESSPGLEGMASFEPPVYQPAQLRGVADEAETVFRDGMARYQERDFGGAILALEEAAELAPGRTDATFFLAASELLSGDVRTAIVHLGRVIETGDVQYLEEALYLRAQAHLLQGNADGARGDLQSIDELGGGWQQRARDQLDRLDAWSADAN